MLAAGSRAKLFGLNTVGLKRQNFREETIRALKTTYRIIFRSGLTLEKAIHKVQESDLFRIPEVEHLLNFLQQTKRGICR
jgi:UDP-N-acetylglucosamine acyltransferase